MQTISGQYLNIKLMGIQIYTKVSQNLPKILKKPSKFTKNIEKSFKIYQKYWKILQITGKFGLRHQKQYIMTYCCRNSMEGTLIQYNGQKTVSRTTPAIPIINPMLHCCMFMPNQTIQRALKRTLL